MIRIQGHRGCRAVFPENSIEGVRAAFASGAFAVELDVRLTADLDWIVVHDPVLTAPYYQVNTPAVVEEMKCSDLQSIGFGQFSLPQFPEQQTLPTHLPSLTELIETFDAENSHFIIEVKVEGDEEEAFRAAEAFEMWMDTQEYEPFRVQCFNRSFLERLHEAGLETPLYWLIEDQETLKSAWPEWISGVALEASLVTKQIVQDCKQRNLGLSVWTVNEVEASERLIEMGVEDLISDDPAKLISARSASL